MDATGERFIPEVWGGLLIEAEHVIRYALATQICQGRRALDAGCGVGWGTRLLLQAGAASASAIDLDREAVEEARKRVPDADVRLGDLANLPWQAGQFDLVVCFEAIEHVRQQEQAFDELVRVLAPGGILMVSSPNPRVYPAGNRFHFNELTPEDLHAAVHRRLPNVCLLHQHEQMASVLVPPDALDVGTPTEADLRVVSSLSAGSDPYSVVVASREQLPPFRVVIGCAPSVAMQLLSERTEAFAQMMDRLRSLQEAARYPARTQSRPGEWEREREALRRERDRLGALLLESEQKVAELSEQRSTEQDVDLEVAELRLVLAQLEHEYSKVFRSTSWRLTKPVRMLGRLRSHRS